jgi:hypothetical protein
LGFLQEMTQYRLAKGWRIFIYLVSPPLIILFLYLLIMPVGAPIVLEIVLKIISVAMAAFFFCFISTVTAFVLLLTVCSTNQLRQDMSLQ